jgi:predicted MFS family arabinose efflux permease
MRIRGAPAAFLTSCLAQLPMGALGLLLILHVRDVTGTYAAGGAVAAAYALSTGLSNPLLARLADRHGPRTVLLAGAPAAAAAIAAQALVPDTTPLAARIALAALAGGAQPPVGALRRRLWNVLVVDADLRHRAYAAEAALLEIVYLLGPVAIVGGVGAWSVTAGLALCALCILAGDLAFASLAPVRALAGDPERPRDLAGALRAPGVVVTLATFVTLGITVGAVEVGVPAALETMGDRSATGLILGLWGVGSMLAGFAIGRMPRARRPELRLAALVAAWGVLHALPAVAGSPLALAVTLLVAGSAIAPTFTTFNGLLDRIALPGTLTEAFTWTSAGMTAGMAAGGALAGRLADAVSPAAALALGGTGVLGAAILLAGRRMLAPVTAPAPAPASPPAGGPTPG